jgi:hypothetical protein
VNVQVGDWVRFMRDGRLVIGIVQYVKPRSTSQWKDVVVTEVGPVDIDQVLEIRKP